MRSFDYVITRSDGLDPRRAGELQKLARAYKSEIVVSCGDRVAPVLRLMKVVQMDFKCGERVTVLLNGEDEAKAAPAVEEFFKENL